MLTLALPINSSRDDHVLRVNGEDRAVSRHRTNYNCSVYDPRLKLYVKLSFSLLIINPVLSACIYYSKWVVYVAYFCNVQR